MFDLHMHTTLSDGSLEPDELLKRLRESEIKCFSITDHNHAKVYKQFDFKELNVIKGVELTTSYKGRVIEVLGYNIEPEIINDWFDVFYSKDSIENNENQLLVELIEISKRNNYILESKIEMKKIVKGISKKLIFSELLQSNKHFPFKTYKEFFRKGLSNPSSEWFIDEGRFYPTPKEVIELIHDAGGIAFLAHPYEYGLTEVFTLFDYCKSLGIDGIECFHPSASTNQSVELAKYCTKNELMGSGGSDFHRDERGVTLGVHVHKDILSLPCFEWFGMQR